MISPSTFCRHLNFYVIFPVHFDVHVNEIALCACQRCWTAESDVFSWAFFQFFFFSSFATQFHCSTRSLIRVVRVYIHMYCLLCQSLARALFFASSFFHFYFYNSFLFRSSVNNSLTVFLLFFPRFFILLFVSLVVCLPFIYLFEIV